MRPFSVHHDRLTGRHTQFTEDFPKPVEVYLHHHVAITLVQPKIEAPLVMAGQKADAANATIFEKEP